MGNSSRIIMLKNKFLFFLIIINFINFFLINFLYLKFLFLFFFYNIFFLIIVFVFVNLFDYFVNIYYYFDLIDIYSIIFYFINFKLILKNKILGIFFLNLKKNIKFAKLFKF